MWRELNDGRMTEEELQQGIKEQREHLAALFRAGGGQIPLRERVASTQREHLEANLTLPRIQENPMQKEIQKVGQHQTAYDNMPRGSYSDQVTSSGKVPGYNSNNSPFGQGCFSAFPRSTRGYGEASSNFEQNSTVPGPYLLHGSRSVQSSSARHSDIYGNAVTFLAKKAILMLAITMLVLATIAKVQLARRPIPVHRSMVVISSRESSDKHDDPCKLQAQDIRVRVGTGCETGV